MSCEFCPSGGGGCAVCDPADPGELPAASGVLVDDPEFCASVCFPAAERLRGRPVPVTIFVAWEWWGVEVSGPAADCLEYLAGREVPASARPAFSERIRRGG